MAKGDVFSINVKIDNQYKVSVFGVCDSALIDSLTWSPNNHLWSPISGQSDFETQALALDKYIPYVAWRNIITPVPVLSAKSGAIDLLQPYYPGLYNVDSVNQIEDKTVYYNDDVILPQTGLIKFETDYSDYKEFRFSSLGNKTANMFPCYQIHFEWDYSNDGKMQLVYPFLILPDDFITDGTIQMPADKRVHWCAIDVRHYTTLGTWKIYVYNRTMTIDSANVTYWQGKSLTAIVANPDPYNPGGTTGPGGGTGDFDNTSDPVDVPATLPPLSASNTGFMTLYNPTLEQVQALANYMWTDDISIWDAWLRTMANPSETILGLSIVPVKVPAGESKIVKLGNISTGISMPTVTSQYVTVDCGTLNVNEYWGAYLDYDPYTKAEIYLPYIGTRPLSVDDIMGKAIHVIYHIDIVSGACVAFIKCNDSVLYNFVGSCSCPVPTTNVDMSNLLSGTISIATAVGSILATNGASAPLAVPAVASTAVNNLKPNYAKSGAMGSMGGMLAIQKPYLILTRPRQALPEEQNKYTGYPAYMTLSLSDCTGYTEIESIHLESVLATGTELAEIESLLKGGVIF